MYRSFLALLVFTCSGPLMAAELLSDLAFASNKHWALPKDVATVIDGTTVGQTGQVLRIAATQLGWHMANQWSVPVPAAGTTLTFSALVQTEAIIPGANAWDTPRLMVMFFRADGTQDPATGVVTIPPGEGWRLITGQVQIPQGSVNASYLLGLHQCAGTFLATKPSLSHE